MNKENILAYAASFVSFLLDQPLARDIDQIIVFGSVARGNFDRQSDIDLFIDTKKNIELETRKILSLFQKSEIHRKWALKGLTQELSLKVGKLAQWKLKRDILSDGITLYGKLKEVPENMEYYLLVTPTFSKFTKSRQVKLWRKLYGYSQKVGKKVYLSKGLVAKSEGKRIGSSIIIPMKHKQELLQFLNKEKVKYEVREIWSDSIV